MDSKKEKSSEAIPMGTGIISRKKADMETLSKTNNVEKKRPMEGPDEKFMT